MKKRIFTRLAAGLLCGALLLTDAASLDVWAVSNDPNVGQSASLAEPDEDSDTIVTIEEEEAAKEAETSPEKESEKENTESAPAEETDEEETENPDQEADEPEGDDAPAIEGEEDAVMSVDEEQESVSENAAEEEPDVNSVMAASAGDIASGTSNDISWVIDKNGKLTVSGTGDFERTKNSFGDELPPWYNKRSTIKSAVVDVKDMTDLSYMFYECSELTTLDLSNLDTSKVTDMSYMFYRCYEISNLDLREFDTQSVTNMESMFEWCKVITRLDLSNFRTENVTNMTNMFECCYKLTTLTLDSFDTSNVTSMKDTFFNCNSLTSLNVSHFDTSKVTDMSYMFAGCYSLTSLDVSHFDTDNVTDMSNMFASCWSLTSLDVSHFNTGNVTCMADMFESCNKLTNLDVSQFDTDNVTNMQSMFSSCSSLTSLDVSHFDTAKVEHMWHMFDNCRILTELDLSNFDVSSVTDMDDMFNNCANLTTIYTPRNVTQSVELPAKSKDKWYRSDGTVVTELPKNLDYSITLKKNSTPVEAVSGTSNDISWKIDANGKLTVSGTGDWENKIVDSDSHRWTPWYDDIESIKTAEINVTGMTDASYMFYGCENLTNIGLTNFDTSNVTNMSHMFSGCENLTALDVSHFNTSKVTDMNNMFDYCGSLTKLDVSHFNTSKVTDMSFMFSGCVKLTNLNVSNFDTSSVTDMSGMFSQCGGLTSIDVTRFDTGKVTNMGGMFDSCGHLVKLNVNNFDIGSVTNMSFMFYDCFNLTELDLSNFDTGNVMDMEGLFPEGSSVKLNKIYTPRNVKQSVELPVNSRDKWYRSDGTVITELPQNLSYSILITKNKKPEASKPHITAVKKRTSYVCGETINIDDITVTYFNDQGDIYKLTEGFTTNVAEINATMSVPGMKTLVVTYQPETDKKLETTIELTVTLSLTKANTVITLPGNNPVYNSGQHTPRMEVKLTQSGTVLNAGTDYTVSYKNNINAGTATVVVKGMGIYSGTVEKSFTIDKSKVKIRVKDTTIAVGDTIPETFACEMTGFFNGDEDKVTGLSFSFATPNGSSVNKDNIDTSKTGIYTVTPTVATIGDNYVVDSENGYQPGTLTIAEERVVYTVTFDMMGHGIETAPIKSVRSGWLIKEPTAPTAEGYLFTGWYKDQACTKVWNFAVDTVLTDTTLYARWIVQSAKGGIQIQEIPEQFYTGNAIKPLTAVYASDGTLLKAGKDYTVKYYNNTNADQVENVTGGISNSLENKENGFSADLPYVEIKGKGNHTGTVYSNFHIRKASIGNGSGNTAAGVTLKYTDQLVTNAKNVQKPFSSLKYKKAMTAGKDYTVTYSSDNVRDADGNVVKAEGGGKWNVTGTYDQSKNNKYTLPAIPKGYSGVFEMTVEGIGNYDGEIKREIYVTDKANLVKNVTVTLGKNQKNMPYNKGRVMTLTPGYSDGKKYYKMSADGKISNTPEANANDLFTVKSGKTFLVWGQDYTVTYTNNKAVGTATMMITGIGNYKGSKSVTFKITGEAFKANTIEVKAYNAQTNPNDNDFKTSMPYTGSAVTQNKVTLTTKVTKTNLDEKTLKYGEHYTISYKNNIKKGTATMTFTAKPESGYSGSFNKTFKIGAVSLTDPAFVKVEAAKTTGQEPDSLTSTKDDKGNTFYKLTGTVKYTREGAKPSQRIRLSLIDTDGNATGVVLKEGTDYTVSYANNTVLKSANLANKIPTMTFKGKGNYTGNLKVTFEISEAAMEAGADNLTVSAATTAYDSKKASEYQYAPKITVKDGKKTLGNKDYTVNYENCSQTEVKAYLDKLAALGTADGPAWADVQAIHPRAVITAAQGSGYTTTAGKEITVYLNIYETKLTGSNLYVVVSSETAQIAYKGEQVSPDVAVYYGETNAVKAAKKNTITDEAALTAPNGDYKLTKLTPQTEVNGEGDYTLTYGANVTAGKNKGSVTVTGTGIYGGSVTMKFTILQRDVYTAP
ncbi:MAG: BspA family leucine-rich repeat surface protein [Lachnospiraceae bacterium]|nr:BspA family leucine-rich repeat surface protein [Lachnospiraceae bacterium]